MEGWGWGHLCPWKGPAASCCFYMLLPAACLSGNCIAFERHHLPSGPLEMPDHASLPHLHTAWWEMCCPPSFPLQTPGFFLPLQRIFSHFQSVLLFTLFSEPRVSKARVGKLEENSSLRNCRHVYFLQAGAAARKWFLRWGLYRVTEQKWSMAK